VIKVQNYGWGTVRSGLGPRSVEVGERRSLASHYSLSTACVMF